METPVAISDLQTLLMSNTTGDDFSVAFDTAYLLVDIEGWQPMADGGNAIPQPTCPVIALAKSDTDLPSLVDLVATSEAELDYLIQAIKRNPVASTMLVQLLRHNEAASVIDG